MAALPWFSEGTQFRVLLALVVPVASQVSGADRLVWLWAALVLGADVATTALLRGAEHAEHAEHLGEPPAPRAGRPSWASARTALVVTLAGSLLAGAAVTTGPHALPLAVIPLSRAAGLAGRGGLLAALGVWLGATAATVRLTDPGMLHRPGLVLWWLALTVMTVLAALWVHGVTRAVGLAVPRPVNATADEAAGLLTRLDALTADLEGGLDPATSAELLLDTLGRPGPVARSAVLIGGPEDRPVPLALRGADRVPWGNPLTDPGAVGQAWRTGRAATVFDPATHREVRAVPLLASGGARVGLVVQDVMAMLPSRPEDLVHLRSVVRRYGPVIGVALAFTSLRERAGMEERERLAREMHDGIAQELVALGFHLDIMARLHPDDPDGQSAVMLDSARTQLRRILGDLRSHISDLRVSVRPERGLGAAMTSRLQSFGTSRDVVVSLRLDETGFRLPARVETVLYRLFLEVLADVKSGGASGVDVDLSVAAPDVTLRMRHDGHTTFTPAILADHAVTAAGGTVTLDTGDGLDLRATFRTPPSFTSPVHLNEKVPQPS